jgi:hypothetical protein
MFEFGSTSARLLTTLFSLCAFWRSLWGEATLAFRSGRDRDVRRRGDFALSKMIAQHCRIAGGSAHRCGADSLATFPRELRRYRGFSSTAPGAITLYDIRVQGDSERAKNVQGY